MNRDELVTEYVNSRQLLLTTWRARFAKICSEENLSSALAGILLVVKNKQPISGREVAEKLGITRGAVAQFVEALVQHGLVERNIDDQDRRITQITLTRQGASKVKKLEKLRNKLAAELTKSLSDKELKQAVDINNKLLQTK